MFSKNPLRIKKDLQTKRGESFSVCMCMLERRKEGVNVEVPCGCQYDAFKTIASSFLYMKKAIQMMPLVVALLIIFF